MSAQSLPSLIIVILDLEHVCYMESFLACPTSHALLASSSRVVVEVPFCKAIVKLEAIAETHGSTQSKREIKISNISYSWKQILTTNKTHNIAPSLLKTKKRRVWRQGCETWRDEKALFRRTLLCLLLLQLLIYLSLVFLALSHRPFYQIGVFVVRMRFWYSGNNVGIGLRETEMQILAPVLPVAFPSHLWCFSFCL